MKGLVVDDEPLARERLLRFLQDMNEVDLAVTAANGFEAEEKLVQGDFDLVLLDIRMPGKTGLEVAEKITGMEHPPAVVFCTAYDDHAIQAFQVQAQAYLLKPIQRQALVDAVQSIKKLNKVQVQALSAQEDIPVIVVQSGRDKERIPLSDVHYFKAEQKYVTLYCEQGEKICDESLKQLEDRFSDQLIRIHRNALVLKQRMSRLSRDGEGSFWLHLQDVAEPVSVSRRFARLLKAHFDG